MELQNANTGVVVSVSDETAEALGNEWVPVESQEAKPELKRGRGKTKTEPTSNLAAADETAEPAESGSSAE